MRFTNGNWLLRKGITAHYAVEVTETMRKSGHSLTAIASSAPIVHRGDMLGGVNFTLEFTSPARNVIGVKITHFKGTVEKGPHYAIASEPVEVEIHENAESSSFRSGDLSVHLQHGKHPAAWNMEFTAGGKTLCSSGHRSIAYFQEEATEKKYISEQLSLDVGECIYGLGERFTPFVKNGQLVEMWQADGGTGTEQAYKNIPFYLSNRGYGVFVNTSADVNFEIGTERVERVAFSMEGESLQYFIIYGKTPKDILERYTFLTGRPALPPAWSFGLWLSTSFTTDYDEATVASFIDGMAERDLPLHVFHFDCFWMKGNHWCDFTWDQQVFPDPKGMLARYREKGLHICVWINPYIAQASSLFDEAAAFGYLIRKKDGSVWQTDLWQSGMGIVDFTNPAAVEWYQDKLESLMDMGVDCFKTDFGERIPVRDICYFDGSDPLKMHNYYTQLYNKAVFDVLEKRRGRGNAVLFARSATVGGQMFPVHWGGDNSASYPSMAETLRAGLSLAVCGFGFWSHDIGGFEATAPADIYKRWCAFGLLSSHSRLHGSMSYRVPWNFDEEAVDVLRFFTKLKCRLMPYLYGQAVKAHRYGTPVMRPMLFEFLDDPAVQTLDRQYLLGESLLVAPVMRDDGKATFYVPEGKWTHLLSGKTYEGGRFYSETYDYLSLPLLVRPNTILPIGAVENRPDYNYSKGLTLHLFELDEETPVSILIPNTAGNYIATASAVRHGNSIQVSMDFDSANVPPDQVKVRYREQIVEMKQNNIEFSID